MNDNIRHEGRIYGEARGGDAAEPVDSGIVNSGEKTNLDCQISKEIDGGKHSGGRRIVGQGYGGCGLNLVQLHGMMTVGSTTLDQTVHEHIATHPMPNVNARWASGFETVHEPHVER